VKLVVQESDKNKSTGECRIRRGLAAVRCSRWAALSGLPPQGREAYGQLDVAVRGRSWGEQRLRLRLRLPTDAGDQPLALAITTVAQLF
jgi:hypothetical protein